MQDHSWLYEVIEDLACYAAKYKMPELQAKLFMTKIVAEREVAAVGQAHASVSDLKIATPVNSRRRQRKTKLTIELVQASD